MNVRFQLAVVLLVSLSSQTNSRLTADETKKKPDVPVTSAQDEAVKEKDAARLEEHNANLTTLLRTGPIAEATTALEEAIAADADNTKLQAMRSFLVARLQAQGDLAGAIGQAETLMQFQLAHSGDESAANGLVASTLSLRALYARNNQAAKTAEMIDRVLAVLKPQVDADASGAQLVPFAQLISAKAMQITLAEDYAGAESLMATECEALKARIDADASAEQAVLAWGSLMGARISNADRAAADTSKSLAAELDATVSAAVEKNPESTVLTFEFLRIRLMEIGRIMRDEPEAAQQLLEKTVASVETSKLKDDPALQRNITQLKMYESRIASARLIKEMIGKPVPELDIEAWAHGEELSTEAMHGKVVLLDFWAIWCGPCIATFPHLKEWHEEFHDQGFEIVGVTQKYGYEWDDETKRATRVKEEVALEAELGVLDKFMAHHELKHATIVTPKGSDISKRFGVTGIPHAVLIDRQGNVRMVKIGSGPANASALREMIVKLLAE